jgi:hypothetical protein
MVPHRTENAISKATRTLPRMAAVRNIVGVQFDVAGAWLHEGKLDAHNVEGVSWAQDLHWYT